MLNKNRIKEAQVNIRSYLDDGLLKKVNKIDENILNTFRKNSEESLKVADFLFKNKVSYLWVIVSSYYAMYYIANAVIYKLGYKVGHRISHKVTSDALIVLVRDKLKERFLEDFEVARNEALKLTKIKTDEIIEAFDLERTKRSRFQYKMSETVKMSKAKTSLKRAKNFVFELEKLLIE